MAEQIIQTLGFDAGQAISAIGTLNGALTGLNQHLLDVTNTARRFNQQGVSKSLGQITRGSKNAESALAKMNSQARRVNNLSNSLNNASKSSASFVLSLQTLSRIALAQSIVRGLNLIQSELSEAVNTAVDFNLALTEAAAISPRGISNFSNEVKTLNSELIETSRSFGFDVLDLAEAKYQEFSNQVRGSAESNRLFVSANKLARISASEVGEAVGALSSVLNSYGQGVENADRVSAALFKTIELGRLRLSDISDQLGNVTPLARDAGIAFEEVAASLATITRAGVSPSRALTQVRALINQLQKPSQDLARLFSEVFQVSGIEEAIQKFGGLQGVIQAVADQAGGDSRKIAQFFTNIRARNAFISLTNQSEQLSDSLQQIGEASANASPFLNALLAEFEAQEAVQFRKALNELKISFLELAQEALPTLIQFINGLNVVVENLAQTVTTVGTVALAAYSIRLGVAAGATNVLAASTLGAQAAIVGLGLAVGVALGELIKLADRSSALSGLTEAFDGIDEITADNIKQIGIDASDSIKEVRALAGEANTTLASLRENATESRSAILEANNTFVSTLQSSLGDLVKTRENFVKQLEDQINGLEDRVTKRTEEATKIREELSDNEFERRTRNLTDIQKAFRQQQRAEEQLRNALDQPTTNDGLEERARILERVKDLAEDAASTAQDSGNRAAIFRAERFLQQVLQEQLNTKIAQNALDEEAAAAAEARLAGERANLKELKDAVKEFQENLSLFSDGGSLLSEEQRDSAIANAKEAFDEIQRLRFDQGDLDVGDLLGSVDLQLRFNDLLNQIRPEFTGVQAGLEAKLEELGRTNTLQIPLEFITEEAGALGLDPNIDLAQPFQGLTDLVKQVENDLTSLISKQESFREASANVVGEQEKIRAALQEIRDVNEEIARTDPTSLQVDLDALNTFEQRLNEISQKKFVTEEDIQAVRELADAFNNIGVGDVPGTPIFGGERAFIDELIQRFRDLQAAQAEAIGGDAVQGQLSATQEFLNLLNDQLSIQQRANQLQQQVSQSIDNSKSNQDQLNSEQDESQGNVGNITGQYNAVTAAINRAIQAQNNLNQAQQQSNPGGGAPRMFGGPIFRAFGGFVPRGTDTIPAMLSPGETVINARSSRKFASQIAAMNAGVAPVYRQEGGVVNNSVNVGDINVNGTADPEATARSVVSQIRREFRRGTTSRFG